MARRTEGSMRLSRARARRMGGGGAGTRTPDTEIMILLLYQLSYAAPKTRGRWFTTAAGAGSMRTPRSALPLGLLRPSPEQRIRAEAERPHRALRGATDP